jgi:hypothetical protein
MLAVTGIAFLIMMVRVALTVPVERLIPSISIAGIIRSVTVIRVNRLIAVKGIDFFTVDGGGVVPAIPIDRIGPLIPVVRIRAPIAVVGGITPIDGIAIASSTAPEATTEFGAASQTGHHENHRYLSRECHRSAAWFCQVMTNRPQR